MSYFPHGSFVAIHAAQEQQRQDRLEEEEMTRYTTDELDNHWEFKIVRSQSGAFRKPEIFQRLLQEESIAGWELVEKLDDRRVRFKRTRDARRRDATLPPGIDPYRSHFGNASVRAIVLIGAAIMIALTAVFGLIEFSAANGQSNNGGGTMIILPMLLMIGVFVFMIAVIAKRRR